eukprot:m51a1_g376 putative 40S ribosomal protein S19e (156) ;mRNA; f:643076-643713
MSTQFIVNPAINNGTTVKDVATEAFIPALARHFKREGKIAVPAWVDLVKTGVNRELPPNDADWFYVRCAAVARKIYLRGQAGITGLRKAFGGKKRNGTCPGHFALASGNVLRQAIHQLEALGLVTKDRRGGRCITPVGRQTLDRIAAQVNAPARQ